MNKYIRKCLIVYTSLALILVGMAGAAYAITATDADQYVTRSQYAVDMAHLQNKLDEAEAGLMGNINRYRSTDVKFVTWDTPNKYYSATNHINGGRHNGGNPVLRQRFTGSDSGYFTIGLTSGGGAPQKFGNYCDYSIYRLWNGNYYITKNLFHNNMSSSPTMAYQTVNYAVPIENFPGWYLEVRPFYTTQTYMNVMLAVIKLDHTSTTARPSLTDELLVRFKKDLFIYVGDNTVPLTTTKITQSSTCNFYRNQNTRSPFTNIHMSNATSSGTLGLTFASWLDPETGDYMMTVKGLSVCYASSNTTYQNDTTLLANNNVTVCKIIPNDNVEYIMGGGMGLGRYNNHAANNAVYNLPVPAFIGTGYGNDPYWQYEIVDGVNGIKYFHAYRPPASVQLGNSAPQGYGVHYSLPIVY